MHEDYEDMYAYTDERKGFINVSEASEILGLHTNTIYKYIRQGKIPAAHIGRRWLINKKELYNCTTKQMFL